MNLKINKYLLVFIQYVAFFGLFYLLFNAGINYLIFPFAFGMLFSLAWANQKVWILVPSFVGAGVLVDPSIESAICLLVTIFCLIVPYFIHVLCKKNIKKWELLIFALLSQTAKVVFEILGGSSPFLSLLYLIAGLLFMTACICFFEAIIIRGFSNKLTMIETISLFSIIAVICSGFSVLNVGSFRFLKLFVSFVLLVFAYCSTPLLTILLSCIAGIGSLVATNNPIFLTPFIFWALVAVLFKKRHRIFMVIGVFAIEIFLGYYFQLYFSFGIIEILPVLISCVVFLILPKRFYQELATIFNLSKDRIAMKNVVNRNREILHRRLGSLSEIFNDMNEIYRRMLKSGMSVEDVKSFLQQEIRDKICAYCPERNHCHRTFADSTKQVFDQLIKIAFEKGRATLLDIPSYLTSRCKQTSAILGSVNTLTEQYKKYINMTNEVDASKVIIADQLLGVSKIMATLSKEVESNVSFDTTRENKILDELTYHNIICIDAVVFEKDVYTQIVSVVVRNSDSEKPRIADVVSKVCGSKMVVFESFASSRPGYTILNLKTAPKIDCVFGVSQKTKTGSKVSGDTYSIVKLDSDKILLAISDGMGSGQKAEQASELSIGLIENFYKAGFDNDLILSTTNKLLTLHKEEIFSAIDICVLDKKSGLADFVKMASPNSFVLNDDSCQVVETGALPLGIVEESKPLVKKNVVKQKDMVLLLSDGISDSFSNGQELEDCIKSIKTKNPQEFADELLERALALNNGYAVDDMTVLAVKII